MKRQGEEAHFAQFWCNVSPFRMNTYKSVSKQRTLTPFRINTYEKQGVGDPWTALRQPPAMSPEFQRRFVNGFLRDDFPCSSPREPAPTPPRDGLLRSATSCWCWLAGHISYVVYKGSHRLIKVFVAVPLQQRRLHMLGKGPQQYVPLEVQDGEPELGIFYRAA